MGKKPIHILVVEDKAAHAELISEAFESCADRFCVNITRNLKEARDILAWTQPDMVIANWLLPDGTCIELLPDDRKKMSYPVVVMTTKNDEHVAVNAIKAGALDYVIKSEANFEDMPHIAERALREWNHLNLRWHAEEELRFYRDHLEEVVDSRRSELAEAKHFAERILATVPSGLLVFKGNVIVFANPSFGEMFDVNERAVAGKSLKETLEGIGFSREVIQAVSAGKRFRDMKVNCWVPGRGARTLNLDLSTLKAGKGRVLVLPEKLRQTPGGKKSGKNKFLLVIDDVTEREQLQREFHYFQKMKTSGSLVSGMAHEFNNSLAAIHGYAQLLISSTDPDHPSVAFLQKIIKRCRRSVELGREVLNLSRLDVGKRVPVKVNQVVKEVMEILRLTFLSTIDLESELERGLPVVMAEPTQLERILINLGKNAQDAMPQGGKIRFVTRTVELDKKFCTVYPWAKTGSYVEVVVEDTGTGIPPEVMERIFEPFFTTKEPGKGTGLGLSTVYSNIKNHRGYILAESRVGHGSRFKIYLPVSEQKITAASKQNITASGKARPKEHIPSGRGASVLVVDDDPQQLEIARMILELKEYRVTLAAHGKEALSIYQEAIERGDVFDLVILDLTMPVMDGKECLEHLLKMDPHARIIIATANKGEARSKIIMQKAKKILIKPIDHAALLQEIGKIQ